MCYIISIQTFNYFRKSIEETKVVLVNSMKAYTESGDAAPLIVKLGIGQKQVVGFTFRSLYSREKRPGAPSTGGRVGPKANLDGLKKKKSLAPAWNSITIPLEA